jgi:hypothetical protein
MDRRTLCHISLGLTALTALVAGITCLALEMPTAGVPLIIVAAILPIGLLERQCPHSTPRRNPLTENPLPTTINIANTGLPKEDNPRPE